MRKCSMQVILKIMFQHTERNHLVNYPVFPNSFKDIAAYYRKSSTKDAFLCLLLECFLNPFHLMIEFIKRAHSINEKLYQPYILSIFCEAGHCCIRESPFLGQDSTMSENDKLFFHCILI